ncbi:MAG: GAF domain-containing protein [Microcoleus vaginatus WJT46-NPBG5]|jgi:GAF domain-containing protein|nr:GAF domain-containing protein [Microcoleus vaginatus WJT46-NPBG5]
MGQQKQPTTYEKQLIALGRTLQTLREEENVDVLIETTLSYLEIAFDYQLLWIGVYDRLDHRLLGKGGRSGNGESSILKQRFNLTPGDILEQVVIQQRPVGVPDLREETRAGEWRKAAQQLGIQGTLIFPMRYKDRCFGVALLGSNLWGVSPKAHEKARLSIILGGLAAAFYRLEIDWQCRQTKHAEQPLLALLPRLRSLTTLDQCLEAVVEETHKFVAPNRTNVYWFEPTRRYFWRRVGNHHKTSPFGENNQAASGIMVSDLGGFYQALLSDQIVSIGEAHSSLKGDITARLMQQIRARSLLAAPILFQKEILGFLAVEGNDARIWQEQEKNYVRGAAQLLALVAPLSQMEATLDQTKLDRALTAGVTHAIYSDDDWKTTLKTCGEQLLAHLKADRFLVLLYNPEHNQFDICYQNQPANRRTVSTPLSPLTEVDTQMLQGSPEAIAIENWNEDFKLMAWRPAFFDLGMRSLLVCGTSPGHGIEGLLVVASETTRSWSHRERELIAVVSQQIGLILHQWQLQASNEQQQQLLTMIQSGLTNLLQSGHLPLEEIERLGVQQLAQVMSCPLVTLVTWLPGRAVGRIVAPVIANSLFTLNTEIGVPVQTDALVQWALLQMSEPLEVKATDLPLDTRQWLNGSGVGQILVMALRTSPAHQPTGILVVADQADRRWSPNAVRAMTFLVNQLAWSRRYLMLTSSLQWQREELECLNWYKNRRLEDFFRAMQSGVKKLTELGNHKGSFGSLQIMHLQQILRQLGSSIQSMRDLLKQEQWHLQTQGEIIPVASLLRRTLDRAGGVIHQRQLWTQVHSETHLNVNGDSIKIEWVLYEVLLAACRRSETGARIDIWCRPFDDNRLELSITDSGEMPTLLLTELQAGPDLDLLVPSSLEQPPGLHLVICQRVMRQMGGQLNFYQLEDGRITSQLLMPLISKK